MTQVLSSYSSILVRKFMDFYSFLFFILEALLSFRIYSYY